MNEPLLAPTFLFHFSVPCLYRKKLWSRSGVQLDTGHRIPSFGELEITGSMAGLLLMLPRQIKALSFGSDW